MTKMKYRAVVSDLDGTLLDENHKVSKYTIDIVNKVIDKGINFFIATGRNYNQTKTVLNDLGIKIPVITSNGARIIDKEGNVIYEDCLNQSEVDKILSIDYKNYGQDIHLNLFSGDDWIISDGTLNEVLERHKKEKAVDDSFELNAIEMDEKEMNKLSILKFFFVGKHENLIKLEKEILKKTNDKVTIAFVSDYCMEIFNKTVNKAIASKWLLEKKGISLEETICFGDGENDFEMLTEMGKGFVMGNAIDRLKEIIPNDLEIIEPNSNNGEARKLKELFL